MFLFIIFLEMYKLDTQRQTSILFYFLFFLSLKSNFQISDGSEKLSDNSPGSASVNSFASAEFAEEFQGLSVDEQDRLRAEWSQVQ